jgi:trk system potassium uptake protein
LVDRTRRSTGLSPSGSSHTVLVVGLGRFGSTLAFVLEELGHEVLGVDIVEATVQAYSGRLSHVVSADATSPDVLVSLGVKELEHAVVAIGDDIESSVLCTAALADLGVPDVWAKANSAAHSRILERVGATHVVFPEGDAGRRVAHQVTGQMIDYVEIDEDFALVETRPPAKVVGKTLQESHIRQMYGVTVVSIKPPDGQFTYTTADTVLTEGSLLLVAGERRAVERFAMQR